MNTVKSPVRTQRNELLLASLLLMIPAAGIILQYANIISLRQSLLYLSPPAIVAAGVLAWRVPRSLTARLAVYGLLGGFAATVAYDSIRLILRSLGVASQPFKSVELYGLLIAGGDNESLAKWAGWLFHFWNGATFGMFYALAFGRPTVLKGIVWGLLLELAFVTTSPKLLGLTIRSEILTSSFVGHVAYGVTLALVVLRGYRQV